MLKLLKRGLLIIIGLAIAYSIFWAFRYFHNPTNLPVTEVIVVGAPLGSQHTVQTIIQHELDKGLITINLQQLQRDLEQLPWIDSVELQRVWPDKLKVTIDSQAVLAYWNDKAFLNKNMQTVPLFADIAIPENLPKLYGPIGSQVKLGFYYQKLSELINPFNLFIIQVTLADNADMSLILNNGIKIELGHQQILTRFKRFVKVYSKVFGGQKDLAGDAVDLRYPSGMAVLWGSK